MITATDYDLLTEQLRLVLEDHVHGGEADEIMAEFDTSLQEVGLIDPNTDRFVWYDDIAHFLPGDIVYAHETNDCFATIFQLGFGYENIFRILASIVKRNGEWIKGSSLDFNDIGRYRYATEEEIKLFNKLTA